MRVLKPVPGSGLNRTSRYMRMIMTHSKQSLYLLKVYTLGAKHAQLTLQVMLGRQDTSMPAVRRSSHKG